MTIKEIIQIENGNHNTIILWREGIFWRAYEKSAYAFSMQIRPYKPTRKWVVAVKQDVISLGFPASAAETVLDAHQVLLQQDNRLVLAASPITAEDFENWKQAVAMTLPDNGRQQKDGTRPLMPAAATANAVSAQASAPAQLPSSATAPANTGCDDLAGCIRRFNIESKTPVECMLFLMELKRRLAE